MSAALPTLDEILRLPGSAPLNLMVRCARQVLDHFSRHRPSVPTHQIAFFQRLVRDAERCVIAGRGGINDITSSDDVLLFSFMAAVTGHFLDALNGAPPPYNLFAKFDAPDVLTLAVAGDASLVTATEFRIVALAGSSGLEEAKRAQEELTPEELAARIAELSSALFADARALLELGGAVRFVEPSEDFGAYLIPSAPTSGELQ